MPRLLIGRPAFHSALWRAQFYLAHDVPRAYIHSLRTDADRTYIQSDHKLFAIHLISAIFFYQVMLATWVVPFPFCCHPLFFSCDNRPLLFVSNTARVIFTFENKRISSQPNDTMTISELGTLRQQIQRGRPMGWIDKK